MNHSGRYAEYLYSRADVNHTFETGNRHSPTYFFTLISAAEPRRETAATELLQCTWNVHYTVH